MNRLLLTFLFCFACAVALWGSSSTTPIPSLFREQDSGVVELTDRSFDRYTQASSTGGADQSWLILFKSDFCEVCSKVKPELDRLVQDPELLSRNVYVGTVNVVTNRATKARFDVRSTPSFVYLRDGTYYTYVGQRKQYPLKKFVLQDYEHLTGRTVPPAPHPLRVILDFLRAVSSNVRSAIRRGLAGVAIWVGVWFAVMISVGTAMRCYLCVQDVVRPGLVRLRLTYRRSPSRRADEDLDPLIPSGDENLHNC